MSTIILEANEVQRTLSTSGGGAFVINDKNVDVVRFSLMSGFADVILDEHTALRVMYQRPGESQVRAQTLTYYDTDGLRNYYDWQLLNSDLAKKGTITCALCILRTDSEVEEWHTTPYQIRVLGSIHTDDSDEADESITPTVAQRVAVLETMIQRVASGAPIVVSSVSAMTDTEQIYVLSTDGKWYYYNGSAWVAGGEYGAVATDTTLTQSGDPADAKAVGERLAEVEGLADVVEEVGSGDNVLDPSLLYDGGTLAGVTISRNDDVFTYNGTCTGTTSGPSQSLNLLPGYEYTFKIYTETQYRINTYIRFFDSNNSTISTISWNQTSDLNSPKTFTVPENTARTSFNIGPVLDMVYQNAAYRFSIQLGDTNESYDKYGKVLSAIDKIARRNIGTTDYNALTSKPSINSVTLEGELSLSDIGAVSESQFAEITESSGTSPNILDPALIPRGTIRGVAVTVTDDLIKFNGTATGSDSIAGVGVPTIEAGKTYTAIIFSNSTKNVNASIRFYPVATGGNMISMVLMRDGNAKSLNTAYTFTVPDNAVRTQVNLGGIGDVVYNNEEYYFEIVEGSTAPSEYKKYGTAGEISAIDLVARAGIADVGKSCYVSPSGSDNNSGTESMPFATFQHAIDSGYKTIIAEAGEYKNQQIQIVDKHGIRIISNSNSTGATLFDSHVRRSRAKIDNSIDVTGLAASNSVYRTALTVDSDSSFYKVFVSKTLDPVYSGSEYYGRITTYNAILWEITDNIVECTRLVPKLTLAECQSTQGSFFYDGSYLYINPTGGDITGKTYKRLNLDTTQIGIYISKCTDIVLDGIDVAYFPYNDMYFSRCSDLTVKDCCCTFTSYRQTFEFAGADANVFSCFAGQAGADGYGISTYGNVSFYDCSAIRCYDDGISHHDAATGVIDGGEWAYCLKGGVTPSFGSNVNVKNVYCHDNVYGIYYTQNNERYTDAVPVMSGCLAVDNTNKDVYISRYNVVSHSCTYGAKQVDSDSSLEEYGNTILQ